MPKFWVLQVLCAAMLLGTGLLGCVQVRPVQPPRYVWDQQLFPLAIQVDIDIKEAYRLQIQDAINTWNVQVGFNILEYQTFNVEDVIVEGEIREPGFGHVYLYATELGHSQTNEPLLGLARRFFDGTSVSGGVIWLDEDLLPEQVFGTTLHEIGHILGLGHDDQIISIMYYHPLESTGDILPEDIAYVQSQVRGQSSP